MARDAYDAFWDEMPDYLIPGNDGLERWKRLIHIFCEFIDEASHPEDLAKWLNEHYPKGDRVMSQPFEHTDICKQETAKRNQIIEAWKQKYPDYCKNCNGRGAFYYPSTWEEPGSSDPCDCTCEGICARCGQKGLIPDTGEGPCKFCLWNYNDDLPEHYECNCWAEIEDPDL